ncbi:hypothetical protein MJO47_00010 [Desulfuromonas sp. KJ2020]|uniref:hypothetical protein n=1 Tax=Desulfuromonas sp. KJ2020 TaxID=2919173 RepID=UPI0020A784D3|nr:hypothetical protein [Desulfuromonas sp. KJ2020]MCP3175474.1 hypothetical protein [Desulfuromonas sp. KJ2020]
MKNFLTIVLSVFVLHFLAASAMAQPYFSGNIGIVSLSDSDIDDGVDTGEMSYDAGFGLLAAVGARLSDNLRCKKLTRCLQNPIISRGGFCKHGHAQKHSVNAS